MKIFKYSALLSILSLLFSVYYCLAISCRPIIKGTALTLNEKKVVLKKSFETADLVVACYPFAADTFFNDEKGFYYLVQSYKILEFFKKDENLNQPDTIKIVFDLEVMGSARYKFPHINGLESFLFLTKCKSELPEKFNKDAYEFISDGNYIRNGINRIYYVKKYMSDGFMTEPGFAISDLNELNNLFESAIGKRITYSSDFNVDHNVNYLDIHNSDKK